MAKSNAIVNKPTLPALLKAQDVADICGIHIQTVWRLSREKRIPFMRIGRSKLYDIKDVLNAMRKGV